MKQKIKKKKNMHKIVIIQKKVKQNQKINQENNKENFKNKRKVVTEIVHKKRTTKKRMQTIYCI